MTSSVIDALCSAVYAAYHRVIAADYHINHMKSHIQITVDMIHNKNQFSNIYQLEVCNTSKHL